jgi:hypothetical protein
MNSITRIEDHFESSFKSHKGKTMSGVRERATKQYFKNVAAHARRKQNKIRFDTFRRDEQTDEEDERLEDIHFANFLGNNHFEKYNSYKNCHVNINLCDSFRNDEDHFTSGEEDNTIEYFSLMVAYMDTKGIFV